MDKRQKTRILILLFAGILLLGGYFFWHSHNSAKTDQELEQLESNFGGLINKITASLPKRKGAAQNNQTPVSGKSGLLSKKLPPVIPPGPPLTKASPESMTKAVANAETKIEKTEKTATEKTADVKNATPIFVGPMPATPREEAAQVAHETSGRDNPMLPILGYSHFPRTNDKQQQSQESEKSEKAEAAKVAKKQHLKLVPPPPPLTNFPLGMADKGGLPISALPLPPDRPTIADKLKLIGIFDDKAIMRFNNAIFAHKNKWPKVLTLGIGEQFESLSVVSINRDSVTLQEDGERTIKNIEPAK